jgi:hypothetical protein
MKEERRCERESRGRSVLSEWGLCTELLGGFEDGMAECLRGGCWLAVGASD